MTTLQSAIACNVFTTENFSIASNTFPRRRRPAVSTRIYGLPLRSKGTSIASRVVPGISNAITRSSPINLLIRVDLPTLGRPTTAIFIGRLGSFSCSSGSGSGMPNESKASSIKPRTPSPCADEIGNGSPKPSS